MAALAISVKEPLPGLDCRMHTRQLITLSTG